MRRKRRALCLANDLRVKRIFQEVERAFGVEVDVFLGYSKSESAVRARMAAGVLVREIVGASFPRIGDLFGRDHTTAVYWRDRVPALLKSDGLFRSAYRRARREATGESLAEGFVL